MMGIYQIKNVINNKYYIGSSVDIENRWYHHKHRLNANKHRNSHLQASWNIYGSNAFEFSFIEECTREQLIAKEQEWLDLVKTKFEVYNISMCTDSPNRGRTLSEEHKNKLSIANLGHIVSKETRAKISRSNLGKCSPKKGIPLSQDTRDKISLTKRNHPRPCYPWTDSAKIKLAISNSKLSSNEIQEIRELYRTGNYSHRDLGKMYGVSHSNIGRIIRGETWL